MVSFRPFRLFRSFRWYCFARFGRFVSLFRVLVHAYKEGEKAERFNVVLLSFCIYISTVNQTQVAPSRLFGGVSLSSHIIYISENSYLRV